ncbi:MAG TPA: SRPBCC domain-containing protein [Cyclobacteriaceae bacterium]|nr:SRPBCC domain-containing protein [Cyclobacteriaceae bacterium]
MKAQKFIARADITINTDIKKVWDALINPVTIKKYMFGTTVTSDWKAGSSITWKGEWQGKTYEDKGVIRQIEPGKALAYTHFSPLTGLPDIPENYHLVTIELSAKGNQTQVLLSQDNNPTEEAQKHSEKNWGMMLSGLKKILEE